jgi:lipoprotein-releasing system permease protein
MNLARLIAYRYLRRPTDALVSAVGMVSVLGLVIGVMALVISMALMTGYRRDLERKLLAGNAEVLVYGLGGHLTNTASLVKLIQSVPGVQEAAPVLFQRALVTSERNATGNEVMLKGIEPQRARNSEMLARIIGPSRFVTPEGAPGVAIGKYLATKLGVKAGSTLNVTVPTEGGSSFSPGRLHLSLPASSPPVSSSSTPAGFSSTSAKPSACSMPAGRPTWSK